MRCVDDLRTGVQLPSPPPFFGQLNHELLRPEAAITPVKLLRVMSGQPQAHAGTFEPLAAA